MSGKINWGFPDLPPLKNGGKIFGLNTLYRPKPSMQKFKSLGPERVQTKKLDVYKNIYDELGIFLFTQTWKLNEFGRIQDRLPPSLKFQSSPKSLCQNCQNNIPKKLYVGNNAICLLCNQPMQSINLCQ